MKKVDEIVNKIYDPQIEDPEYQGLMASCIKAWLRDAVLRGMQLGEEELAIKLDTTIKKHMNPGSKVIVFHNK